MIGKRAVVAGATGSIGRLVVQTCLEDPRVDKVTAIVRKTLPNDRAEQLWGKKATATSSTASASASKLVQVQVDYPKLSVNDTNLKELMKNHDAFITALGVYSGNTSEAEMKKVEGTYNTVLATLAHDAENGATRGAYLSGQGVKQPTLEGRASSMFGRVKGHVEESLASIFVNNNDDNPNEASHGSVDGVHLSVRPAAIFDRPGPPVYGFLDGTLLKMWPFRTLVDTSFGITAHDIAKGMVQGALFDTDTSHVDGNTIWENVTLKEAARRYDANRPSE